jgi:hypothetical protein
MWQVYAYLAHDMIETKRRDADRARMNRRPKVGEPRGSLVHRLMAGRTRR